MKNTKSKNTQKNIEKEIESLYYEINSLQSKLYYIGESIQSEDLQTAAQWIDECKHGIEIHQRKNKNQTPTPIILFSIHLQPALKFPVYFSHTDQYGTDFYKLNSCQQTLKVNCYKSISQENYINSNTKTNGYDLFIKGEGIKPIDAENFERKLYGAIELLTNGTCIKIENLNDRAE